MAEAKSGKGSIKVGDIALVGALVAGAWMLKEAFGGIGKGVGDLGAGLGDLFGGISKGLQNVTGAVPAVTEGLGSWGSDIGGAFNFGSGENWLNKVFQTVGNELGDFGSAIDLTDSRKYDWLAGDDGLLENIGDFGGWLNPWD